MKYTVDNESKEIRISGEASIEELLHITTFFKDVYPEYKILFGDTLNYLGSPYIPTIPTDQPTYPWYPWITCSGKTNY